MFYRPDKDEKSAFDFSLPLSGTGVTDADWMTASEQMFFLGSPLAHVVSYEEELRHDRIRRSANLCQARRIIDQWLHPVSGPYQN